MAFKTKKRRKSHKIKRDRYGIPNLAGDSVRLATWGIALGAVANYAGRR